MRILDAAMDLLFQGSCPGCRRSGCGVCQSCVTAIMAGRVEPHIREGIDLPLWSAGIYEPPLTRVISQAKDHNRLDTIDLLGTRLAFAIAGLLDAVHHEGKGILVPVPSLPRVVRSRGLDVTHTLAKRAEHHLRAVGLDLGVTRALRHARDVKDQGDLTTEERHANLRHSLVASPSAGEYWAIIIDDVVTTGASLTEASRALREAGYPLLGLATISATVLRSQ